MRPRLHFAPSFDPRFLRSRGDAPEAAAAEERALAVPPLTRRCARAGEGAFRGPAGSSAHAEMRPTCRSRAPSRPRFLRSRGDAPWCRCASPRGSWVPPLTRRCAASARRHCRVRAGSSAHAEMRPSRWAPSTTRGWFLRSRGDAPGGIFSGIDYNAVPPLTRRCALSLGAVSRGAVGSSAHAEMRPCAPFPVSLTSRFLRSRGDAPVLYPVAEVLAPVPPLTRRCADPRGVRAVVQPGSSAHAEMRPPGRARPPSRRGFLRSRGDAPLAASALVLADQVPPLTRRCALFEHRDPAVVRGSSAHAEMRRSRRSWSP